MYKVSPEKFQEVVCAAIAKFGEEKISDHLGVAEFTIERWSKTISSTPAEHIRVEVAAELNNLLSKE